MPIYEFEGQHYDIATDDHAEAKRKILGHLGRGTHGNADTSLGKDMLNTVGAGTELVGSIPGAVAAGVAGLGTLAATGGDVKTALKAGHEVMGATTPSTIVENFGKLIGSKGIQKGVQDFRQSGPYQELIEKPFGSLVMGTRDIGSALTPGHEYGRQETGADAAELALIIAGIGGMRGGRGGKTRAAEVQKQAAELRARQAAEAQAAAEQARAQPMVQGEFPQQIMDTRRFVDPTEMMERYRERADTELAQRAEAVQDPVQPDMFQPSKGEFPGMARSEQLGLDQMRQGIPYEQVVPPRQLPREAMTDAQPRMEPFRQGDLPFDLPLEQLEFDPFFATLKEQFDKFNAEHQKQMQIKQKADERSTQPKSEEAAARLEKKAQTALERANEAQQRANEVLGEAKDYYGKRLGELGVENIDGYTGSLWADRIPKGAIEKTPVYSVGKLGGTGKKGRRQGGSIEWSKDPEQRRMMLELLRDPQKYRDELDAREYGKFRDQVLDKDVVDQDFLWRRGNALSDYIDMYAETHKDVLKQLMDKGKDTIHVFDPVSGQTYPMSREMAIDYQHKLWQHLGEQNEQLKRVESLEKKIEQGLFKRQQGHIKLGDDPEYRKFKDSLPAPMKRNARLLWKEMQKPPQEAPVVENAGTLATMDEIPGLQKWAEDIMPITKSKDEIKAVALTEPDMGSTWRAKAGRQLVSGAKILGLGTDNTVVRWIGQKVDTTLREAQKNIDRLILSKETGFKPLWEKLNKEDMSTLWAHLTAKEGVETLTREQLFDLGLNEKQVNAAEALRKALDEVYERLDAARAAAGKKPFDRRFGYIPSRFRGDFTVHVRDAQGKLVHIIGAMSKREASRIRSIMLGQQPDLVFGPVKHEPLHRYKDASDAQAGYQAFLDVLKEDDPRVAQLESIYQDYLNRQAYNSLGVKKHFMDKTGVGGAEGFKPWEDAYTNAMEGLKSTMNYMDHALKWAETQHHLKEVRSLLADAEFQKAQPETSAWGHMYIDQALGRSTKMARAFDTVFDVLATNTGLGQSKSMTGIRFTKKWLTAMYLGFGNTGFSLSQIVQVAQTQPALMAMLKAKGAEANILNSYARGLMDATSGLWFGAKEMTALGREAWSYAKDYGLVEPKFLDEVRSLTDHLGTAGKAMDFIATWNMTYFEKMARTQSYMTWVHFLHETGQFKMGKELYQLAGQLTDNTMVDYRAHERPMLYKQFGIAGEMASALTTFKHNYYSQAWALRQHAKGIDKRYVTDAQTGRNIPHREAPKQLRLESKGTKEKGAGAAPEAALYGTLLLLSGLMGVLGREDVDGLIRLLNNASPFRIPTTRELILKAPDLVAFGPTSVLSGMDMSTKFSAANVIPDDALTAAFPFASTLGKIGGAAFDATMNPGKTSAMKLLHEVSPMSLRKFGSEQYFREGDRQLNPDNLEGTFTRKKREAFGHDMLAPDDWTARGMALRTLPESRAMHDERTRKEGDAFYTRKRTGILNKANRAHFEGKVGPMYQPMWQKLMDQWIDNEGDPQAFTAGLVSKVTERKKDALIRNLERASRATPQRARRLLGK